MKEPPWFGPAVPWRLLSPAGWLNSGIAQGQKNIVKSACACRNRCDNANAGGDQPDGNHHNKMTTYTETGSEGSIETEQAINRSISHTEIVRIKCADPAALADWIEAEGNRIARFNKPRS